MVDDLGDQDKNVHRSSHKSASMKRTVRVKMVDDLGDQDLNVHRSSHKSASNEAHSKSQNGR